MADATPPTALSLGREIERGTLDPRDLVEDHLARIAAEDPRHLAVVRVAAQRARAEAAAAAARAKAGLRRSPLDGVAIAWKDLFDTAGLATEGGSPLLAGRTPRRDAGAVRRLAEAGAIMLAKTNMTELAFSGLGINTMTGTPPNPFDAKTERCPGGSSSGSAVALARGWCAAAMGSDTGGSIRVPAAWNGLVGFKPSINRLDMTGVLPLASSFDTIGPLTRDVADAAAIDAILADLSQRPLAAPMLPGLRLWQLTDPVENGLDPGVERLYRPALARLAQAGVYVDARPWTSAPQALALAAQVVPAESFGAWGALIEAHPEKMSQQLRGRFGAGRGLNAAATARALQAILALRRQHDREAAGFDALVMPTMAVQAPMIAPLLADPDLFASVNLKALRNTRLANILGLPALTLPIGRDHAGLPVGLSLVGRQGQDRKLLALGLAVAGALGDTPLGIAGA